MQVQDNIIRFVEGEPKKPEEDLFKDIVRLSQKPDVPKELRSLATVVLSLCNYTGQST